MSTPDAPYDPASLAQAARYAVAYLTALRAGDAETAAAARQMLSGMLYAMEAGAGAWPPPGFRCTARVE